MSGAHRPTNFAWFHTPALADGAFFDKTLQALGVMRASGAWNYGANRLVIAGDAPDRGRDDFAVLWRLHGLSLQAAKAGGVTLVLGNHDQYLLRGNMTRAHREHVVAHEKKPRTKAG